MFFCLEIQPTSLPGQISSELKAVIPSRVLSPPDTQIHASQRSYRMYQPLGLGKTPCTCVSRSQTPEGRPSAASAGRWFFPGEEAKDGATRRERIYFAKGHAGGEGRPPEELPASSRCVLAAQCQWPRPARSHGWETVSDLAPPSCVPRRPARASPYPPASPLLQRIPTARSGPENTTNKKLSCFYLGQLTGF